MNAEALTKALDGRWHGSYGTARCSAHEDRTPSLSVRDGGGGTLLTHCHAGCPPEAVWAALQDRGLVERAEDRPTERSPQRQRQSPGNPISAPSPNQGYALDIWHAARPAPDTPVEAYLRHRGITIPVPPTLRYHPGVRYERSGLLLPCMVAAVQAPDGSITGIHRTWIRDDGMGKAAIETPKMALGPIGAGAVRLGAAQPALGIAEGIETALSAMQIFSLPCWAALGSNIAGVELPQEVIEVQIFGDNGTAGHAAGEKAAEGFKRQGRRVFLRFPPADFGDWNDFLQDHTHEAIA